MYTREFLDKLGYFKDIEITHLSDSLTGVISRKYILDLARELVNSKTPFTMAILDIDNFKFFNDNYGHIIGDECLISISKALMEFVGERGLVGRFGGDEFIIIYFGDHTYEEAHKFVSSLYGRNKVVRRIHRLSTVQLFVTATVGNASFPRNTDNYEDLFRMVDKALYRGKTKGRNCYITYVKEKHEHIDVHKKEENYLRIHFKTISDIAKLNEKRDVLIKHILNTVTSIIGVTQSLFIKTDGYTISSATAEQYKTKDTINSLIENTPILDELYSPETIDKFKKSTTKEIKDWIKEDGILTFLISEVRSPKEKYGNILLIENNVQRIWQDRDNALIMYVDRILENLFIENK